MRIHLHAVVVLSGTVLSAALVGCARKEVEVTPASAVLQNRIECRKARIAARRLPLLEWSLAGMPMGEHGFDPVKRALLKPRPRLQAK